VGLCCCGALRCCLQLCPPVQQMECQLLLCGTVLQTQQLQPCQSAKGTPAGPPCQPHEACCCCCHCCSSLSCMAFIVLSGSAGSWQGRRAWLMYTSTFSCLLWLNCSEHVLSKPRVLRTLLVCTAAVLHHEHCFGEVDVVCSAAVVTCSVCCALEWGPACPMTMLQAPRG
jgi:hypothetical protein